MGGEQYDKVFASPAFARVNKGILSQVSLAPEDRAQLLLLLEGAEVTNPFRRRKISEETILSRQESLSKLRLEMPTINDPWWYEWLAYKDDEIKLLIALRTVQRTGDTSTLDQTNRLLYGELDSMAFLACINHLWDEIYLHKDNKLRRELVELLPAMDSYSHLMPSPSEETFAQYQEYVKLYFSELLPYFSSLQLPFSEGNGELIETLSNMLEAIGAKKLGWTVLPSAHTDKISINPLSRTVRVSPRHLHMGLTRIQGMLLHEVGIHVVRRLQMTGLASRLPLFQPLERAHEEGLGVLIEQLALKKFHWLRLYRYVALCLAAGVDGKKRSVKDVYEILWRTRFLATPGISEPIAKQFAAKETLRVFRGIAPNTPGAVIWKDKAYLEGNMRLWHILQQKTLTYDEFKAVLTRVQVQEMSE